MRKLFSLLIILALLFSGCGGAKPDDVSQEIWDSSTKIYSSLKDGMNGKELTHEENVLMDNFCDAYGIYMFGSTDCTEKESDLIGAIYFMRLAYFRYLAAIEDNNEIEKQDAIEAFKENEEIYRKVCSGL
jgi:hypothetical protein